jgi:choline dehydrogenase-like flavoprotein
VLCRPLPAPSHGPRAKCIAGLRVADASSIMASDCRADSHFTTVMIGEAIARMMLSKPDRRRPLPP